MCKRMLDLNWINFPAMVMIALFFFFLSNNLSHADDFKLAPSDSKNRLGPMVYHNAPESLSVGDILTIIFEAEDLDGIAFYGFKKQENPLESNLVENSDTWTSFSTNLFIREGSNQIWVYATDMKGNTTKSLINIVGVVGEENNYILPERDLRIGMRGEDVAQLQYALARLNYPIEDAEGVFGRSTMEAVVEFQLYMGLEPTGIVDQQTADRIQEALIYS